jgi:filamentous hemagglutinin
VGAYIFAVENAVTITGLVVAAAEIASGIPNPVAGELNAIKGVACTSKYALKNIDNLIAETMAGKGNLTSKISVTADELLIAGESFLGEGYKEIGKLNSGVFRSADGTRQFRIDRGSISGWHAPNVPHGHLQIYPPNGKDFIVNNHIPFTD